MGVGVREKLNSVEIESAMAHRAGDADAFGGSVGKEFDFNARAQTKMGNRKQAHSVIAEIDAESVQLSRSVEDLHGSVQQLARAATPVGFEGAFENHALHKQRIKVAQRCGRTQVTEVQWRARTWRISREGFLIQIAVVSWGRVTDDDC